MFKKINPDALWRAIENAREAGVRQEALDKAEEKLKQISTGKVWPWQRREAVTAVTAVTADTERPRELAQSSGRAPAESSGGSVSQVRGLEGGDGGDGGDGGNTPITLTKSATLEVEITREIDGGSATVAVAVGADPLADPMADAVQRCAG